MNQQVTKLFLGLALTLSVLSSASVHASDPCDPTVRARDSYMACRDEAKGLYYSIAFQTMMSSPACPFEKHVEVSSVLVKISDGNKPGNVATIQIQPGYFKAERGLPGTPSSFSSELLGLDLSECATPADGGLSAGN